MWTAVWRLQLWTSVHFTLSKTFRTWEILRLNLTPYIIVIGLTSTKLCHWSRMYFDKPKKVSNIKQTHQAPIFCIHCIFTINSNTISFCKLKMYLLVSKSDWYYNHISDIKHNIKSTQILTKNHERDKVPHPTASYIINSVQL